MKIYIFESLKMINQLRKRLNDEENLSQYLTQSDLNRLEESFLNQLTGLDEKNEAFNLFFKETLESSELSASCMLEIEQLLNISTSSVNETEQKDQKVEEEVPAPQEEIKVVREPILKRLSKKIKKYKLKPQLKPVIKFDTQNRGFFDKFWDHFKDELSVNWFLFLGAFLVFGAGIVYSLMNWKDLSTNSQFIYSLAQLFFFVLMEFLLRVYMELKKSPKVFSYLFFLGAPLVLFLQSKLGLPYFMISIVCISAAISILAKQYELESKKTAFLILLLALIYPIVYCSSVQSNFVISIAIPLFSIAYLLLKPCKEDENEDGLSKYFRLLASFYFLVNHFILFNPMVFTWILFVFSTDFLSRPKVQIQRAGFFYAFFFLFVLMALSAGESIFLLSGSILFLINLTKMQMHSPYWLRGWMIIALCQLLVFFTPPYMFFTKYS
ncbi:hypothetical protein MJH12_07675, partial [bacterium]|nr:hypothetical protein [bacterium]